MFEKKVMKNKSGQVTIFIIIAVIIVAGALLVYSFFPQIQTALGGQATTPQSFIQTCIEKEIKNTVDKIAVQGGSITPENYLLYQDKPVDYLCYTDEFYKTCTVQQPNLLQHMELEVEKEINDEVNACFESMKASYERKGYAVDVTPGKKSIELRPKKISATFDYVVNMNKGEEFQKYDSFNVVLNNNIYELVLIANNILGFETLYGDSETTAYMSYYHDLKVEKILRDSGTKIYIITDRNTGDKFQFASRSQVWPSGYTK